ncbi:MAG: hypothetical protein AAFY71_06475 [Bacteroidota bacterium]
MAHIDSPTPARWFWFLFFFLAPTAFHLGYAHITPSDLVDESTYDPNETIVRIAGQIIEQSSQRPVSNANVMVRSGDLALTSKMTDEEGRFEFFIPAKKISSLSIGLRINYLNHIFSKDDIRAVSQEMLILINGAILLEESPMSEYSLPIHRLEDPKIGQVHVKS